MWIWHHTRTFIAKYVKSSLFRFVYQNLNCIRSYYVTPYLNFWCHRSKITFNLRIQELNILLWILINVFLKAMTTVLSICFILPWCLFFSKPKERCWGSIQKAIYRHVTASDTRTHNRVLKWKVTSSLEKKHPFHDVIANSFWYYHFLQVSITTI